MVRAVLKKMQQRVLVGDWVMMSSVEWTARRGMVTAPLPRTGPPLVDPPVANVQQLVLCFALADPPVEAVQLTRFLVSAEATGLPFVLVFNKADLGTLQRRHDVAEHMRLWGYHGASAPRFVSVATGEGTAALAALLGGTVTAIAGPSGVGKSSLINALRCTEGASNTDADVIGAGGGNKSRTGASGGGASDWEELAEDAPGDEVGYGDGLRAGPAWEVQTVKAVSGRSRRGRHTTRHVSLLRLPGGGLLADTPGFGLPSLEHVTTRMLPECFPEVRAALAAAQRREFTTADFRQLFSYCRHGKYRQAKDLLKSGCPVDGRDQFGNTPLIIACQNSHARLVKALLRHGAAVDAANRSGNTGLHYAVAFGFTPLADFLISQGANDKVRNAAGLTPYEGIK